MMAFYPPLSPMLKARSHQALVLTGGWRFAGGAHFTLGGEFIPQLTEGDCRRCARSRVRR
jgi:hypothetical protein